MSFSASSDSGRRRIVCKERFPPTDCATVGRCSASPSSASIQVTTWSQLMMVMHHRWGGSLKGPDYHNHCDAIDLCDRLANCLFLPNVFIHAVMINAKKEKLFGYLPWEAYCIRRNLLRTMSCHLLPNLCWLRLWHLWCTRDITGHYIRLQLSSQYQTFMVKTKTWRGSCLFCTVAPQRQETWQRDSASVL